MIELKTQAFNKAMALLKASDARYIIIDGEGVTHTNDETLQLVVAPTKKVRTRIIKYPHRFMANIYQDAVKALKPSDCWTYDAENTEFAEDLRSAVTAYCSVHFGNGTCMSTAVGKQLQILRVT